MSRYKEITGKRFNRLVVIKQYPIRTVNRSVRWECKCDCGKTTIVSGRELRKGIVRSCGCLRQETLSKGHKTGKLSRSFKGFEDISSSYFTSMKWGAITRNLEFNITIEQIWNLFIKQNKKCALSGLELKFNTMNHLHDGTASLDRIDSLKGYTEGNIQWIHKDINKMKMDFPEDKFINYCKLISKNKC